MAAHTPQTRELAFNEWYECDKNDVETTRRMLNEHRCAVSRATISEWIAKYDWESRASVIDSKKQDAIAIDKTLEHQILQDMLKQKRRYERYFESLGDEIDIRAMSAYGQLTKQIVELHRKMRPDKPTKQGNKGLNADTVHEIKREILGMNNGK